jgi:hypothetical protein
VSKYDQVAFIKEGLKVRTEGLKLFNQSEIGVEVSDPALVVEGESFLRYLITYLNSSKVRIQPGETLNYGYWLVKFQASNGSLLEVWEYEPTAVEFVRGATLALTYWRNQHRLCAKVGAAFTPPRPDRFVVVSDGTLEGKPVHGTRYPAPEDMSGWWILTDSWDGDANTLRREHLYHLTTARPELAQYLALPWGYMFDLRDEEKIWFDQKIADQSIPQ